MDYLSPILAMSVYISRSNGESTSSLSVLVGLQPEADLMGSKWDLGSWL
jgi:hypothetical protein